MFFGGILLVFLAFWKGDGGYHDLVDYMDAAEGLWLRGSLAQPREPLTPERMDELRAVAANPRELAELVAEETQIVYNKYSVGLPILSGPFVLAGAALEKISSGRVGTRKIAALAVPVLGALACLLIFEIGMILGQSPAVSLWAALVFALGSPLLTYVRQYFAEVAVIFCGLLALWAFLKSRAAPEKAALGWGVLAGAGLAGATACHYAQALQAAALWLAFIGVIVAARGPGRSILKDAAALTAAPLLVALALLWLNYSRYGHPLRTGGYAMDVETQLSVENISHNLLFPLQWYFRTPWLACALALSAWAVCSVRATRELGGGARALRIISAGLLAAYILQCLFWMSYQPLGYSPLRYQQPLTALCVLGLLALGAVLHARAGVRGLWVAAAACIVWNAAIGTVPLAAGAGHLADAWPAAAESFKKSFSFLYGDDSHSRPFTPSASGLLCYVWYMTPFPANQSDGYGMPMGAAQWALFAAQLLAGFGLIWRAALRAVGGD